MEKTVREDILLHKGRRYDVWLGHVGGEERAYLKHPGAVVIIPVTDEGELILIRNFRFVLGCHLWEVPAGTLEEAEGVLEAAHRELKEETGYSAGKMSHCFSYLAAPAMSDEVMHVFIAEDLTPGRPDLQPDEDIETFVLSEREIEELEGAGEIVDAKTLLGISLWRRWRNGERFRISGGVQ